MMPAHHATRLGARPKAVYVCAECLVLWPCLEAQRETLRRWCDGKLHTFIADESSMCCVECGWIGWPRQVVEPGSGRVLKVYPHTRRNGRVP